MLINIHCKLVNDINAAYLKLRWATLRLHGRVFLRCGCAGDSWASVDGGSVCYTRSSSTVSRRCGSAREHAGEPPDRFRNESWSESWNFINVHVRFMLRRGRTWTKAEPHVSHLYGFSPEWMRRWVFRLAGRLNWALHTPQRYGFSPAGTIVYSLNLI